MRIGLAMLAGLCLVFAACGDDDDSTKATGHELSDEGYLAAICGGTSKFSDALMTKTKAEEIGQVIKDFSAIMKALNPPADLKSYNQQFVKYLDDAVSDPTSLVTRKPPLPPDDARQRLAQKANSVSECKDGTLFNTP